ncbi:MAG: peptidase M56, partial [Bacteroidota bacterium]
MQEYLIYLLEANICLLVFYAFYYCFLKNETNFNFCRFYLLGSTILSVLIPVLHFSFNPFDNS